MAAKTGGTVLRSLREAVGAGAATDRELLERFTAGDEAAFTALVSRHTPMVLGVCRRVLPTVQDAEDACQATFLVLAQKAKAGRWQASIANWLYTTARRVASRASRSVQRRKRHEAQSPKPAEPSVLDQMTGREAFLALDEELDRLPAIYREPLVLCHLQGLTRDEAVVRLGVTLNTLKSRLDRGRKRLADALTKRGIELGAGLLAAAATSSAGASPPRLVASILAAAGGSPSPAVAALAQGVAVNGIPTKAKVAVVALVGVALLGLGISSLPGAADPRKSAMNRKVKDETNRDDRDAWAAPQATERTVAGKVVDVEGRPLVADLHLIRDGVQPEALGKSTADGTFRVTVPLTTPGAWLLARAPGHGVDFVRPAADNPAVVTLRLPKSHPIRGRILDLQGRPVAEARVAVNSLSAFDGDTADRRLRQWLADGYAEGQPPSGNRTVWFSRRDATPETTEPFGTRTDVEGRFAIDCVGLGQLATLVLTRSGIAAKEFAVFDRPGFDARALLEAARAVEPRVFSSAGRWQLSGPEPAVVVEPEKVICGTVTDRATGLPRPGVRVTFTRSGRTDTVPNPRSAITDRAGRFEIRGARKSKGYTVECDADAQAGYLPGQAFADDTPGYEPIAVDLKCARGIVVTGRITEKATGKPVGGLIHIAALANNPNLKNFPDFVQSPGRQFVVKSEDRGHFRAVTIPGPTLLMVSTRGRDFLTAYRPVAPDPKFPDCFTRQFGGLGYFAPGGGVSIVQGCWCKVIDAREGDSLIRVDVDLDKATKTMVKAVDDAGRPVRGTHATGITHQEWNYPTEHSGTDVISVYNVDPPSERLVVVAHIGRKLVGTLTVKADDKDPVVKLGSGGSLTGRLVGATGKPLAGVEVRLYFTRREVSEASRTIGHEGGEALRFGVARQTVTDADGAFRLDTLFPGQEFRLAFHKGKQAFGPAFANAPRHLVARHGDTLDLGALKFELKENNGSE